MYRRPAASILVLILLPFAALASEHAKLTGPDWPQHRGNSGSTGVSPDDSVKPPLKLLWSYRTDSDTTGDAGAGLTVGGGKVICNMVMTRSVLALDADTGAFCWEFFHNDMHYMQTSGYAGGKVFIWLKKYGRSTLVALDSETGKQAWTKKLKSSASIAARRAGPALADGKVLVAEADGKTEPVIICLEAATGKELWRKGLGKDDGLTVMSPSIAGGMVFTGTRVPFTRGMENPKKGAAVALSLAEGKEIWRNREIMPTYPLVSDGEVTIAKFGGQPAMKKGIQKVWVLDAKTGKERWSVPVWTVYGTTSILKDRIIIRYKGATTAHDRKTGKIIWGPIRLGSACCISPSISGNIAYLGSGSFNDSEGLWAWRFAEPPHQQEGKDGLCWTFHAMDLKTGKVVWQFLTGNNACGDPAIAYGRLYLNSRDGRIYCLAPVKDGRAAGVEAVDKTPNAPPAEVKKLLVESLPAPRPGKDWPMAGGTPERVGLPGNKLNAPLTPAWTLDTGGRIRSSAAIRDGKVFVGSLSGKIFCADLKSGAKAWEFDTKAEVRCSPAVAGGLVYCGSDNGKFYALDASTGKEKWSFQCGGPVQASPAVVGGVVVFGANDHNIYMLDRKTGKKLWNFRGTNQLVQAPPVVKGNRVIAAQWIDWVYSLDATTGKEQWKTCVPISIESLHYYRDKLWLRTPRQFAEFDPASGKRLRLGNGGYGYGGLAFMKDVMLASSVGAAIAVNMKQKGRLNKFSDSQPALKGIMEMAETSRVHGYTRFASMNTPLVLGGLVCFASTKGEVMLIKPDPAFAGGKYMKHELIWSAALGGTCHATPSAADGMLVVGSDDGSLYAFRGK